MINMKTVDKIIANKYVRDAKFCLTDNNKVRKNLHFNGFFYIELQDFNIVDELYCKWKVKISHNSGDFDFEEITFENMVRSFNYHDVEKRMSLQIMGDVYSDILNNQDTELSQNFKKMLKLSLETDDEIKQEIEDRYIDLLGN